MLGAAKLKYLIQLLTPVFFLPLLTAGTLIVLPSILFNLLSTFSYQTNVRYHYTSLIIPVFAWAAIAYLRRVKDGRARDFGSRRALAVVILVASLRELVRVGSRGLVARGDASVGSDAPTSSGFRRGGGVDSQGRRGVGPGANGNASHPPGQSLRVPDSFLCHLLGR